MKLKRHLPHIDLIDHYQFVTFRTYESIDHFLKRISEENISTSLKQYKADQYLDKSLHGAYLNGEVLQWLKAFLIEQNGTLYDLVALSIMPNHVHLLFKQKEPIDVTIKKIKAISAIAINKMLGKHGTFWEKGYFDKGIRDQKHFDTVYRYIAYNAVKADLADATDRFYSMYE